MTTVCASSSLKSEGGGGGTGQRQLAVGVVLDDRHAVARGQLEQLAAGPDRQRDAGRILVRRVGVNQLRAIPQQQLLELVDVGAA